MIKMGPKTGTRGSASQRQGSQCCAPRSHPSPTPHLPVPVLMPSCHTCDRSALQPPLGSMLCFSQLSACTAAAYCRRAEACTRISTATPMSCWYFRQSIFQLDQPVAGQVGLQVLLQRQRVIAALFGSQRGAALGDGFLPLQPITTRP